MNYIEALRRTKDKTSYETLKVLLGFSGSTHTLTTYFSAAAAENHRTLDCQLPKTGEFHKFLIDNKNDPNLLIVLFPWDLIPELDWRSGLPAPATDLDKLLDKAGDFLNVFVSERPSLYFYVDAISPPLFQSFSKNEMLSIALKDMVAKRNFRVLTSEFFDLGSYLRSECPIASNQLWSFAKTLCDSAIHKYFEKKVLITDCDNVLWSGVIAEDQSDGINAGPEGPGYGHFLYQTYLKQLLASGILLVAVTKNHSDDVLLALSKSENLLKEKDFIAIMASYKTKSSQVHALSKSLNLGLNSFVFVDDNEVEIADMKSNRPEVTSLLYPQQETDLPRLFQKLNQLFSRDRITKEDVLRLDNYKRNFQIIDENVSTDHSIDSFLISLNMTLIIQEKCEDDLQRTVQLINKTNQFNNNGQRTTESILKKALEDKSRIFSATLVDNGGTHGEILSALINNNGHIEHYVMSCRVFQRNVEYVFFHWLFNSIMPIRSIDYRPTERNEPFQIFMNELSKTGEFSLTTNLKETIFPKNIGSLGFLSEKCQFMTIKNNL
mgnify:CR=1 FL=1